MEEVWAAFPSHVRQAEGLTLRGLQALYADGGADPERDYQLLVQAEAEQARRDRACTCACCLPIVSKNMRR